ECGFLVIGDFVAQLCQDLVDQWRGFDGRAQSRELVASRGPASEKVVESHLAIVRSWEDWPDVATVYVWVTLINSRCIAVINSRRGDHRLILTRCISVIRSRERKVMSHFQEVRYRCRGGRRVGVAIPSPPDRRFGHASRRRSAISSGGCALGTRTRSMWCMNAGTSRCAGWRRATCGVRHKMSYTTSS